MAPLPRTLLIGFDGGTWGLLEPAIRMGALPHLQRFLGGALKGTLRSVEPSVTIPAWYSATTGLSPASLDMWGFTAPTRDPGKFRLVTTYRPHEALWDRLGRKGWRVGVVGFPAMPAPPVHGYFISGMLDPHGAPTMYPRSLEERIRVELGDWQLDLPEFGPGDFENAFAKAAQNVDQKALAVEMLQGDYHPDLLFVLFSATDRIQHVYYDTLARFPDEGKRFVRRYWNALDDAFHRVVVAFHEDGGKDPGYTWLLSDHGFGPSEGYFFTNRFLERHGYLRVKAGQPASTRLRPWVTSALARADEAYPMRETLRWVDHLRHRVAPTVPGRDGDALDQTFGWFSQFVDWDATRAVSFPVPEAIYANTYRGPVPRAERARLVREIQKDLRSIGPAQIEAVDPEVLYHKELPETSPILLLTSHQGAWEIRGDVNHQAQYLPRRPSYFQREGCHRPDGVLALAGPGIPSSVLPRSVGLLSIAPTVLRLVGDADATTLDAAPDPVLSRYSAFPLATG
jgi:predicted AlkP superfamily phosphohydrolase/phosphomutase